MGGGGGGVSDEDGGWCGDEMRVSACENGQVTWTMGN